MDQLSKEKTNCWRESWDNTDAGSTALWLQRSYYNHAYEVNTNIIEMNGRLDALSREMESIKQKQMMNLEINIWN